MPHRSIDMQVIKRTMPHHVCHSLITVKLLAWNSWNRSLRFREGEVAFMSKGSKYVHSHLQQSHPVKGVTTGYNSTAHRPLPAPTGVT